MSLIKLNQRFPFFDRVFPEMIDINQFFNDDLFNENLMPALNVKENDSNFEIELAAPGFSKKDFEVTITENVLNIKAENKKTLKEKEEKYSRQEFFYNSFKRTLALPKSIDFSKKINAKYENGVLRVHLEKLEALNNEERKKVIEIV